MDKKGKHHLSVLVGKPAVELAFSQALVEELRTTNRLLALLIEVLAYQDPIEAYKLANEARKIVEAKNHES